jgi:cytochrome c oxidase subunit III
MVTSTKTETKRGTGSRAKFPGPNGKKPGGNGWQGGDGSKRKFSPARYRITMWVILAAIAMMFAAISSAYVILSTDEQREPVAMPPMFFVSTGIILTSSWTFERAKRSLQSTQFKGYTKWLVATLVLGLSFLGSQLVGWRELARAGVYFASHPHSTFFYFFTGLHGAHLLGGIFLLSYLLVRTGHHSLVVDSEKNLTWTAVVGLYWHAMDAIWIWLFLLLLILK